MDVLQQCLNNGLFQIGEADDIRFEKLRKAAEALTAQLAAQPSLAVEFALAAFDPEIPLNDPVLDLVAAAVQGEWQTYRTRYSDVPRTLFRALLLQTLSDGVETNEHIALIVSLLGKNLVPHRSFGVELKVISELVRSAGVVVEEAAESIWSVQATPVTQAAEVKRPKLAFPVPLGSPLDQQAFAQAMQTASAGNPYNAYQNSGPWAQAFGAAIAPEIARAIQTAVESAQVSSETIKKEFLDPLATYVAEIKAGVRKAAMDLHGSSNALRLTNQLIWWKEAGYSKTAKSGYDELDPFEAAMLAAVDLATQVPVFTPESVEHFLLRAVRSFTVMRAGQCSETALVAAMNNARSARKFSLPPNEAGSRVGTRSSRKLLLELLPGRCQYASTEDLVASATGLDPSVNFTPEQFAVWVFRELQIERAAAEANAENVDE